MKPVTLLFISVTLLVASFVAGRRFGGTAQVPSLEVAARLTGRPSAHADTGGVSANSPAIQRALAVTFDNTAYGSGEIYEAVQRLSNAEVRKMSGMLGSQPGSGTSALRSLLAARRAEFAPESVAAEVLRLPDGKQFADTLGLVAAWAKANPDAALAEADRLP